jgi:hypothetical protein
VFWAVLSDEAARDVQRHLQGQDQRRALLALEILATDILPWIPGHRVADDPVTHDHP